MECGDLAGAQRAGVADQEDRTVADADAGRRVDARHDLGELGDRERVCLTPGRGAQDAAQAAAHPSYDRGGGRVDEAFLMVAVGDRSAVAVQVPLQSPASARSVR